VTSTGGAPEFSRPCDIRQADGRTLTIAARDSERAALAERLGIVAVDRLSAELTLTRQGDSVAVGGTMAAAIVQSCAVSTEDLPVTIAEPLQIRFVPARDHQPNEELELDAGDLDEIEFDGATFDLGEAVAQSLALAIDPFATGPEAEEVRRSGLLDAGASNPFAVLAQLKTD
jgi:uncharacterized metal-binding protein YceD (DUF177 family)